MKRLPLALAALAVSSACQQPLQQHVAPPPTKCAPENCLGCCNDYGLCESGVTPAACGAAARACVACPMGARCLRGGVCAYPPDGGVVSCGGASCGDQADVCINGACSCNGGPACPFNQACINGFCGCGPCAGGCCSSNVCLTVERGSAACGKNGAMCAACDLTADSCSPDGDCACGAKPACPPGVRCTEGVCQVGEQCPDGCASGSATCIRFANQTVSQCGEGGTLCGTCDLNVSDHCGDGVCRCGSGGSCPHGLICQDGRCACTPSSCTTGCCLNGVCVDHSVQSTLQCGPPGGRCISCPAGALCLADGCDCQGRLSCGAVAIAAGADHTCAVTRSGSVRCWGESLDGGADLAMPAPLFVGSVASSVAAGTQFTCAVTSQGVQCFGALSLSAPLAAPTSLTAGAHHACVLSQTKAYCWGADDSGQLGIAGSDGGFVALQTPVALGPGLAEIAAGTTHTCARNLGHIYCWGRFDPNGSTPYDGPMPHEVLTLSNDARLLASGDGESCAVDHGRVFCWGKTPLLMDVNAKALALGSGFGCLLADDGGVQCWGTNTHGQQGGAGSGLRDVTALNAGRAHACVIADDQQVWCWGEGAHLKLGSGNTVDAPTPLRVAD